jgi:hypothetical protein
MPTPMPSDRALLRANELADTQKQRADEAERVLRRVGLSWHDFAQYDRCKPWVKKPWHRQYGRTSIVGEATCLLRKLAARTGAPLTRS